MFEAYFGYVIQDPSRLSQLVHSTVEAGASSLYALALTLGVSVEGVLRLEFEDLGKPSKTFVNELSKAQELISLSPVKPNAQKRICGSLNAMKGFRAQQALETLIGIGAVTSDEVAAWKQMRHRAAHADLPDSQDVQAFLDVCLRMTVLFYRLIFTAIGYRGAIRTTELGTGPSVTTRSWMSERTYNGRMTMWERRNRRLRQALA